MCQVFRQLEKPSEAVEMLHRVEMMALRVLIIFAGGLAMEEALRIALSQLSQLGCQRDAEIDSEFHLKQNTGFLA